ncbi:UDP-glucose/GDP-mannose dehydrogenase family protein [Streptomyces sp. N2-109]|uniref:UDP-glucose 6-dehydrogenase n=1 Tax=Streptomyces gossypii TaxID=2883101 RepID=A0ABT2JUT9_9ACTN|nr:UDP-glucose/GDP-mannose dehydrogenase family protein [Streptomyces gossypii]MCT2591651.1 UDP-glucose/GDP-mannose dehydrogenase family protein [Streptomyces gossypii]
MIGTGYLGTTHAVCMAALGFETLGMDVDAEKAASLSAGRLPFHEPGLESLLRDQLASGRLRFTTSYEEVAAFAEVHFSCVGTPQRTDGPGADLRYTEAVVEGLGPHLSRPCLLVGKSTVPVGTAERLAARLAELAPAGRDAEVAWNPEFLREGFAVRDTLRPDRLVLGVASDRAERLLREVYAPLLEPADGPAAVPLVVTDLATAELVKVAANSFLATKISFINAMAEVCEVAGADVQQLAEALSYDPRIGGRFLRSGVGFGGGCLPKDIRAFMARAEELGVSPAVRFLREVDEINLRRRAAVVDLARRFGGGTFHGRRITVLGAAFKPDSDDVRDSPALAVAERIRQQGAEVTVYDPKATDNARKSFPALAFAESVTKAACGAHVLLHLTEWPEFGDIDPVELSGTVARRRIIDGRNTLDASRWRAAGWEFRALGRP